MPCFSSLPFLNKLSIFIWVLCLKVLDPLNLQVFKNPPGAPLKVGTEGSRLWGNIFLLMAAVEMLDEPHP